MLYSARQLMHLAAVLEAGSLSVAAQQLGVTQPALTRSLNQLEASVGEPLIVRSRSGARATTLGASLAVYGQNMLNAARRAEEYLAEWSQGVSGHLIVGAPPTIAANLLPPVVANYLGERPKFTMRVEVSPLAQSLAQLLAGKMDIYIGVVNPSTLPEDLTLTPIYRDRLRIYARKGHPIHDLAAVAAADLSEWRWTMPFKGSFFRGMIDSGFNSSGVPIVNVAMETFSFDLQRTVLHSSDFVAMLPERFARFDDRIDVVEFDGLTGRELIFDIAAVFRSQEASYAAIAEFIQRVRGHQ